MIMDTQSVRTPATSPKKQFCPLCQCPFKVLAVDTPAIHMQKCKFRQRRPRGECPDGVHCIERLPAHYSQYSHNVLEKFRNNPENAPQTSRRSRSIEQMFHSLHGKARKLKTKEECNASMVNKSPLNLLKSTVIELSDSQTSSEEFFSTKGSQSSAQSGSSHAQSRTNLKPKIKSPFTSVNVKREPQATPQKHKLNLGQKSTPKSAKKLKLSKKPSVKIEKGNDENPWTIAASQASKSPRVCKIYSMQNDDIIDLTDDITPPIDAPVLDTDDATLQNEKDINGNNATSECKSRKSVEKCSDCSENNENEIKRTENNATCEVSVNMSKNNSLNEWLKSPQRKKPSFLHPIRILNSPGNNPKDDPPPRTFQATSSTIPNFNTTPVNSASIDSGKSQHTTQETVDSEDWVVEPPRGPGFVPVSPIEPPTNYHAMHGMAVSSGEEYVSAESDLESAAAKATKKLKFPTSTQQKDALQIPDNSKLLQKVSWPKKSDGDRDGDKESTKDETSRKVDKQMPTSEKDTLHVPVNSTLLGKATWPTRPSGCNKVRGSGTRDENSKSKSHDKTSEKTSSNETAGPSYVQDLTSGLTKQPACCSPAVVAKKARLGSTRRVGAKTTTSNEAGKTQAFVQTNSTEMDAEKDTLDKSGWPDDEEEDELLNCSLLLGQTQMFTSTLPWKGTHVERVRPSDQGPCTSVKLCEDGASKKNSNRNTTSNTDETNIAFHPPKGKISPIHASHTDQIKENIAGTATISQHSSTARGLDLRPSDQNASGGTFSQKPKTKQADIGSMLFGLKPKVKPQPVTDENALPKQQRYYGKGNYSGGKTRRCPFYKKIEGTTIAVDAFNYGTVEGIEYYLLSHYHFDHYQGLTKKHWKEKVYCSEITGNLVSQKIGLSKELIVRLPMREECQIGRIKVTLLEANHCPGAVLFLFKLPNNRVILHTGDFRAVQEHYDALQNVNVDLLYLDTTYLDPSYQFPPQSDVINTAVSIATGSLHGNPKTLFVVGTYLIGKERIFAAIAKAINSTAFVAADKYRTIQCLMDEELRNIVTKTPAGARVHVVAMKSLNQKELKSRLQKYKEFEEIVAIKPTGWTHDRSHPDLSDIRPAGTGPVKIYGLPYSEHSSFEDLRGFVKFLRPKKIIPTVNVARKESRDMMSKYLDKWKLGLDV